jgi:hypothetical protein
MPLIVGLVVALALTQTTPLAPAGRIVGQMLAPTEVVVGDADVTGVRITIRRAARQ